MFIWQQIFVTARGRVEEDVWRDCQQDSGFEPGSPQGAAERHILCALWNTQGQFTSFLFYSICVCMHVVVHACVWHTPVQLFHMKIHVLRGHFV